MRSFLSLSLSISQNLCMWVSPSVSPSSHPRCTFPLLCSQDLCLYQSAQLIKHALRVLPRKSNHGLSLP